MTKRDWITIVVGVLFLALMVIFMAPAFARLGHEQTVLNDLPGCFPAGEEPRWPRPQRDTR